MIRVPGLRTSEDEINSFRFGGIRLEERPPKAGKLRFRLEAEIFCIF